MAGVDETDHILSGIPLSSLSIPDVPLSPKCPEPHLSPFLQAVRKNDVTGVKKIASSNEAWNPNDSDELGRTAFVIAIDHNFTRMIQCLLEIGLDPEDALFHAIETHSLHAVRLIIEHLPETKKQEILNRFPKTQGWPCTCKPLILAARLDNLQIVKTLIQHGAEMPPLESLYEEVEADDSYGKFLALLHWYEAISGEAYIMLTAEDPLETIFNIGRELEDAMKVPRFRQECDRIHANLHKLSTKLLGLARGQKEVQLLLTGGQPKQTGLPHRLQQALDLNFKEFVSHPSSQDYMVTQWSVSSPYVRYYLKSQVASVLLYCSMVLCFFIPCILYIFLPAKKLDIMQRPFVRFLLHTASRLYFLVLLILSTVRPQVVIINHVQAAQENLTMAEKATRYIHYRSRPWDAFTFLIIIWIVGMTFRTIRESWLQGWRCYLASWNLVDSLQLVLYWVFIVMSIVAYIKAVETTKLPDFFIHFTSMTKDPTDVPIAPPTQSTLQRFVPFVAAAEPKRDGDHFINDAIYGNYGNESRYDWEEFDPLLVAEAAFAVANVLTYLNLIHSLLIVDSFGPLLISFRGMAVDVAKFFVIFIFILISFSLGLTQLYRTFEALDMTMCTSVADMGECAATPFITFLASMQTLFWSLFNPVDVENLSVNDHLHMTNLVGTLMYAIFLLVGGVVLLNALIAMMSNTYTRVEENSEVEWKVARTKLIAEYMTPAVTLPPPFNLVPTVKMVLRLIRFFHRKCCSNKNSSQPAQVNQLPNNMKKEYKVLSRTLGLRFLRASKMERATQKRKSLEAKRDQTTPEASIESLSQEIKELRCLIQQQMSNN